MEVIFELADGTEIKATADVGMAVKDAALAANVPNILGDCGGNLSCATCHVVVPEEWTDRVGGPNDMEDAMLDITMAPRQGTSRLSCQIEMTEDLDGLRLRVPEPE